MRTPFEDQPPNLPGQTSGRGPARSVFNNFTSASTAAVAGEIVAPESVLSCGCKPARVSESLQNCLDAAMARMFFYQFLARAFDDSEYESWEWLTSEGVGNSLRSATNCLVEQLEGKESLKACVGALLEKLRSTTLEDFKNAYVMAFGHAARGDCPLNEIEYGQLKSDPLAQPHRLADLAAFYRAFGLEVSEHANERADHLGMELEFMSVLATLEAYADEHQADSEERGVIRDAQKKFLREHLGAWAPAFGRRLARVAVEPALAVLGELLKRFVVLDCERFGIAPGNEDLLLRPVDQANESLCDSCGLSNAIPRET